MKRRFFLQIPLLASALASQAKFDQHDDPKKGFKVEQGKDRYQEELHIMGGQFDCKVSGNDTNGQVMVLFQPAGSMEDFFKQMSKLGSSIPKDQETKLKKLWADHGMEIVGPPLKF